MRIKLFEDFNRSAVLDEVDQCLVDLSDMGFTWGYSLDDYTQFKAPIPFKGTQFNVPSYILTVSLHRNDKTGFKPDDIRDSVETMIEYFDEKYGVKSYSITKPDSPGPGIEVDLNDRYNRTIFYLNIKINLGRENYKKCGKMIKDIFVELCDSGFSLQVKNWPKTEKHNDTFRNFISCISIDTERNDKQVFDVDIIEEYDLMLRDYLDDVLPGYKIEYLLYSNNGEYAREYELGSGYLPRLVIKVIVEDENS